MTSFAAPAAVWDMLMMALRMPGPEGDPPQVLVSTTPKLLPILKASDRRELLQKRTRPSCAARQSRHRVAYINCISRPLL